MLPEPARAVGRTLLEALFPGRCLLCGAWLLFESDHRVPLCAKCREMVTPQAGSCCARCGMRLVAEQGTCIRCRNTDYFFESNIALFPYTGAARILMQSLKFGARQRLAPWFANHAWMALKESDRLLTLVPVPSRRITGGGGIVAQVTRCLQRSHAMTVRQLLERRGGAPQKSLNYVQRQENLKERIHLAAGRAARSLPAEVVLVDDVFTTGATLDACARVLRSAGCTRVFSITLAIEE